MCGTILQVVFYFIILTTADYGDNVTRVAVGLVAAD